MQRKALGKLARLRLRLLEELAYVRSARKQAEEGPFYPRRRVVKATLENYAKDCAKRAAALRREIAQLERSNEHARR